MQGTASFHFSECSFDPTQNTLQVSGNTVTLEQKLADLLLVFCQSDNLIIPKDTLIDAVWQNRIVNDDSLSVAVSKLRKLLGDNRQSPVYIKTIPGKGYQWLPETHREEPRRASSPNVEPQPELSGSRRRWPVFFLTAALLVAGGMAAIFTQPDVTDVPADAPKVIQTLSQAEASLAKGEPDDLRDAISLYREVLNDYPENVHALLGVAKAKLDIASNDMYESMPLYLDEVTALLTMVLELEPQNDQAWIELARLEFLGNWNVEAAENAYEKAIEFGPEEPQHYLSYTEYLLSLGRFEETESLLATLRARHPGYYQYLNMSFVYFMRKDMGLAKSEIQRLKNSEASSDSFIKMEHRIAVIERNNELAFDTFRTLALADGMSESALRSYRQVFEQGGLKALFQQLLEDQVTFNVGHYRPPMSFARYAIVAEQYDEAIRYLRESIERHQSVALLVSVDPHFDALRSHPDYEEVMTLLPPPLR